MLICLAGCQLGGDAGAQSAVGIELPAVEGFPALQAAVVVRPDTPGERYVEPLAGAIAAGLRACRDHAAAPLGEGIALAFALRDGRLVAANAREGLSQCLTRALDGAALGGLDRAAELSLWLRAAPPAAR